jgi:pseudaminic acid cytidylyltransferase
MSMRIAVIPARGGSKRIPRKNVKNFCGKPMIGWPIAAALASGIFERVIVSTDDPEIAAIALSLGAEVPFMRPAELANDDAGTTEVVAHATQWALNQQLQVSEVCCIYATAAFVEPEDLRRGLSALESGAWCYAFSATEFPAPIFRAFRALSAGGVRMFFPEHMSTRSQDLPPALHDAGQFYWGTKQAWLDMSPIFSEHSLAVLIPRTRSQDIDTPEDWEFAEALFRLSRSRSIPGVISAC